jgi:hypothetical protein
VIAIDARAVLADLRATRRRHRVEDFDWVGALYHAYVAAIISIVVLLLVSNAIGDSDISAKGLADFQRHGPTVLGLVTAVALAIGLRSGSRGGPFALEAAEVRHVLLAPIDRASALRGPAIRLLRFIVFAGAIMGAASGQLASRRLPHSAFAWAAAGAAYGIVTTASAIGIALIAGGRRIQRPVASLLALAIVTWAALDVARIAPSPFRYVGHVALWPISFHSLDLVAVGCAALSVGLGLLGVGGYRIENAERRTGLVGQIRFAATMQDLRTVIVLRRQLAFEQLRSRPWFGRRQRPRRPRSDLGIVWRRDLQGIRRFPLSRIFRMLVLSVGAALALRGVWHGTTPLAVVAAAALLLVGYEAAEPLAQEVDHTERADLFPVERGLLESRHLPSIAITMLVVGAVGMAVPVAIEHTMAALVLGLITLVPASLCAASGAVVSVALAPPEPFKDGQLLPPEVAGMKIVVRAAWPLIVSMIGTAPVIAAAKAARAKPPAPPHALAATAAVFTLLPIAFTVAWLRFREPAKAWWRASIDQMSQQSKTRASARTR